MFLSQEHYSSIEAVQEQFAGAAHIEPVDGGWIVFASASDYDTWRGQK